MNRLATRDDAVSFVTMSKHAPSSPTVSLAADVRVAVIAARFNAHLVDELLAGCVARLRELGVFEKNIATFRVPGAFELPVAAKHAAEAGYAAVVCLGVVIRGDTPHFDYVAGEAARGINAVAISTGVPVIFGVLTTNTEQQALARTGGAHSHAGRNAAEAAVEMVDVIGMIRSNEPR